MTTLFNSLKQLSYILIMDTYFILIFAIFGLTMWKGQLHYRCRKTKYPVDGDWEVVEGDHRICGSSHTCEVACGSLYELMLPNEEGVLTNYTLDSSIPLDRDSKSIFQNYGITNFDSILSAYLTIFQCTTLEGWSDIMIMIEDGYNIIMSSFFFILCVLVCSYFLLNLTLAVMLDKFKRLEHKSFDKIQNQYEMNFKRVQQMKELDNIMELHNKLSIKDKCKIYFS